MTIYLALTVTVIMALCLALIEGCRYRGISLETECVMDIGMDSILAEYHRELQKQYNLFAIDCSYGTESASTKLTESHLLEYMNRNFSLEDVFLENCCTGIFCCSGRRSTSCESGISDGWRRRSLSAGCCRCHRGYGGNRTLTATDGLAAGHRIPWTGATGYCGTKQQIDAQIQEYDGKETTEGKPFI